MSGAAQHNGCTSSACVHWLDCAFWPISTQAPCSFGRPLRCILVHHEDRHERDEMKHTGGVFHVTSSQLPLRPSRVVWRMRGWLEGRFSCRPVQSNSLPVRRLPGARVRTARRELR